MRRLLIVPILFAFAACSDATGPAAGGPCEQGESNCRQIEDLMQGRWRYEVITYEDSGPLYCPISEDTAFNDPRVRPGNWWQCDWRPYSD